MWGRLSFLSAGASMGFWILTHIPIFHRAYTEHQQRLDDDHWLRTQCADPQFFSKLRRHTSLCDDARDAFARPAWLVGLQACMPTHLPSLGWEGVVVVGLVLLLAPGILLPIIRTRAEQWERRRVLEACSPMLPLHWKYAPSPGVLRHRHPLYVEAGDGL